MKRGEVWWVNLDPTRGGEIQKTRPAVILTVNALNRARRTVVVVPLSSSATPRPPIVVSVPSTGAGSVAVCDQVPAYRTYWSNIRIRLNLHRYWHLPSTRLGLLGQTK
ncbi:MAG: type II toxin-antitoxin system PemK/MazF family toxin [Proteobacteria bacterium]|nr:type II toxin-antitoxin system PemK/MazF family toxin [Pseudomonadota bacterium]